MAQLNIAIKDERLVELELLVKFGYGNNVNDVGAFLIARELDDLKRAGVLKWKDTLPATAEK